MKKVIVFLTVVWALFSCINIYAFDVGGEDTFFSVKSSLWYEGVSQQIVAPKSILEHDKSEVKIPEVKSSKVNIPEELSVALKNL